MTFSDNFTCHSPAFSESAELEQTGRILLPESVLNDIYQNNERAPPVMFFAIRNPRLGNTVYAGIQSFTAPPGIAYVPYWMMEYLQVEEGGLVRISLTSLMTATRALFQPQDEGFLKLPNPRVILEYSLRQHPCLTQGTVLNIHFNEKVYRLKVMKTEPKSAVQILKADVICDFAAPLSQFDHRWNEADTDSSDEEGSQQLAVGRTIRGAVHVVEPKPIHSTLQKREEERKRGNKFAVTRIEYGKEILPPKPKEKKVSNKKEVFTGQGRIIKTKKGESQKPAQKPISQPPKQINQQQKQGDNEKKAAEKKNYFLGTPHKLK